MKSRCARAIVCTVKATSVATRSSSERPSLRDSPNQGLRLLGPVALATRRFGRGAAEKIVVEQAGQQNLVHLAAARPRAIAIHRLPTLRKDRDHAVDQRVRRADIESDHVIRATPARQPGEVRDATQIEREPVLV